MSSSTSDGDDDAVTLLCTNPDPIEPETKLQETPISTWDIHALDSSAILRYQTLQIRAHRGTLLEHSSYFQGLLSGSFSESGLNCVSIEWDPEIFVYVLKCIYGRGVEVNFSNFLSLFEAALYFGVERLLSECKSWFCDVLSPKRPRIGELQLDDLIHIWKFGIEHASDFVLECASYLARNFMWAASSEKFGCIPYGLILCCIEHPHLTVYSERHLAEALLGWINFKREWLEPVSKEDVYANILKQIRTCLLPLWFAAGKRKSCHFSELSDKSIENVLRLTKIHPSGLIQLLGDGDLHHVKIRLTEYSKKVDLSGCPQITVGMLLLSLLPSCYGVDLTSSETTKQFLINLEGLTRDPGQILRVLQPALSFEAVQEVDISKCQRLDLAATIECFSNSFPSLQKIKAAYLLNFKATTLHKLLQKCPLIVEVDLTVDITSLIPTQVSVMSSSAAITSPIQNISIMSRNSCLEGASYHARPLVSNVSRLTLEGRSDICDIDLQLFTEVCVSLRYINLKGCVSVTDGGIAYLIRECPQLHSVLVCDTSFGRNSVQALCFMLTNFGASPAIVSEMRHSHRQAYTLQILHIGGCKDVSERSLVELISRTCTLKSLCLRGTNLIDDALYSFSGSSLEILDVSNTMISGSALSHVVCQNPALKCLNLRDCRNLILEECTASGLELPSLYTHEGPYRELGDKCILEELALGWGFSFFSLHTLKPAILSLRKIIVGLGCSLGEDSLRQLPTTCPLLESITLSFQVISDRLVLNMVTSLRHLKVLALCYCFGDISISSLQGPMPNLRKLRLQRVCPLMTNDDLNVLIQSCTDLVELALVGCRLLNSDSLHIISHGWPGLMCIHLEDCGESTAKGVSSLFNFKALENLLLRHSGSGIPRSFILDAVSKMPMLRQVSLDICDACGGDFDIPSVLLEYCEDSKMQVSKMLFEHSIP